MPRADRTPDAPAAPPRPVPLPAYTLYGEAQPSGLPDLLHLETIAQRSRLHEWEIRPRRHASLFQILVIARGVVQARLDSAQHRLQGPCAIGVPAMVVHGFRFEPDVDGMVITLAERQLPALVGAGTAWRGALDALRVTAPAPPALLRAAQALRADYRHMGAWRAAALDTGLRRLLLELARAGAAPAAAADARRRAPGSMCSASRRWWRRACASSLGWPSWRRRSASRRRSSTACATACWGIRRWACCMAGCCWRRSASWAIRR
ncbi:MAG: AraC family ligand binding domain-containing protein [Rubrivivax sp.]|nr:AraC family ligand binding domain-containing protein [Rubrivivax sp.]